MAKTATEMNTYLKGLGESAPDRGKIDQFYSDFLVDAKAVKVKIAEYLKRDKDVEQVDQFSRFGLN